MNQNTCGKTGAGSQFPAGRFEIPHAQGGKGYGGVGPKPGLVRTPDAGRPRRVLPEPVPGKPLIPEPKPTKPLIPEPVPKKPLIPEPKPDKPIITDHSVAYDRRTGA